MEKIVSLPAAKLIPVFENPFYADKSLPQIRYRGARGGRGSAKTKSFARMLCWFGVIADSMGKHGVLLCAREFYGSLADSSFTEIVEAIDEDTELSAFYEYGREFIRSKNGKIEFKFVGLRHNVREVKGIANILIMWVDEAEAVTEDSWNIAINTVRADGSEIWITWNPERKTSATNKRFNSRVTQLSPDCRIIELNWRDNDKFPQVLELERLRCYNTTPDMYDHIWEGDFKSVTVGAYYSKHLTEAKANGRILDYLNREPLSPIYAFWDIGSSSNNADATSIWIAQNINGVTRWLDYYEAIGQDLATHLNWLRVNNYELAINVLPHDGAQHERVFKTTYEGAIANAGFNVTTLKNQGRGAALLRIEAARRLFGNMIFNATKCEAGLEALSHYHEKKDEVRGIGLGVEHDWASHAADAFGYGCVYIETMLNGFKSSSNQPFKVKRLI